MGVGILVGCESIVHSVSSLPSDSHISPELKNCLLVDLLNAFNSMDREVMFQEVQSRLPSMAAWIEFSYGSQPIQHFGDFQLLSCTGDQQGDPLCPLCFALTLHPLIEQLFLTSASMHGTLMMVLFAALLTPAWLHLRSSIPMDLHAVSFSTGASASFLLPAGPMSILCPCWLVFPSHLRASPFSAALLALPHTV